ncbi:UDP-N-acetylmuramate dehydrogenase [Candidatus Woesebacteria bacterium]|nr:UDP-N-acetylmuramate dehydrogenase [Candidatus Woesebacteria bacterium]
MVAVLQFCQSNDIPYTLLGGASNVLVSDAGIDGLVILNQCAEVAVLAESEVSPLIAEEWWATVLRELTEYQFFVAETGIKTAELVKFAVSKNLSGLEPFLGVPGTLGGAIYNNSHYTNELIGDFVVAVEVLTPDGQRIWLNQEACEFAYDDSRFHRSGESILRVIFALLTGERSVLDTNLREATVKRATTQPLGVPSSGCMFRNVELPPEKQAEYDGKTVLSAGWLIDQAGLKGTRVGGAVVSDKHANFLVNDGGATAADIQALAETVRQAVLDQFGIELEREVFFIGEQKGK